MNSRLKLRLEAARLAAQLSPSSAADLVKKSRTIEKYILGKAQLPERFNEEDIIQKTVHEAMLEMTGANDVIQKFNEMDKDFHEKYKNCTLPQDKVSKDNKNTNTDSKEDLYVFSNGLILRKPHSEMPHDNVETNPFLPDPVLAVDRQHDPTFRSKLMKVFAEYPSTGKDLAQVTRERQELYHDMGLAAEPFNKRHPHPPCNTARETAYLAPGGMPCSEAESIYLQQNGEKVE